MGGVTPVSGVPVSHSHGARTDTAKPSTTGDSLWWGTRGHCAQRWHCWLLLIPGAVLSVVPIWG